MIRLLLFFLFSFAWTTLISQKEDYNWIIGENFPRHKIIDLFDVSKIDFNYEPPKLTIEPSFDIDFFNCNTSISDSLGALISYSNGMVIKDYTGEYIEDTINYSHELLKHCNNWEAFNTGNSQVAEPRGSPSFNGAIFLRWGKTYMLIYHSFDKCKYSFDKLKYTLFDYDYTTQKFKMIKRDVQFDQDLDNIPAIAVIRHGNGRDWWLATVSDGHEYISLYLVTNNDIVFHSKQRTNQTATHIETGGQMSFSPSGDFFAFYTANELNSSTGGGVCIARFERCNGIFSNFQSKKLKQYSIGQGIAFSPDSKYLYACNNENIFQYDTEKVDIIKSERLVAKYDGFIEDTFDFYLINFGAMELGPDGRIYVTPTSAAFDHLSTIEYPNEYSISCDVRQHSIHLPKFSGRTNPHLPNYRLGPLDGSSCDTLGLDNLPIAKYRYEPDSIDYKRIRFTDLSYFRPETWNWDFGDGSPKISIKSPYHTFPKDGTYKVCLTVSNENSSNTSCRDITIGVSSSDDESEHPIDVNIFPNPVQDVLLITIGEYVPAQAYIEFYSALGQQVHRQRVYYGHNNVDMTALTAGVYAWRIVDKGVLVKSGEVVKM